MMGLDFDNIETYTLLLQACKPYKVDPSSSLEAEEFFRQLLHKYEGDLDTTSVLAWLNTQLAQHFIALGERPRWIQGAAWAYDEYGRPMVFAGQIDLQATPTVFHDDTSLYIFVGRKVPPVVVMQQF